MKNGGENSRFQRRDRPNILNFDVSADFRVVPQGKSRRRAFPKKGLFSARGIYFMLYKMSAALPTVEDFVSI